MCTGVPWWVERTSFLRKTKQVHTLPQRLLREETTTCQELRQGIYNVYNIEFTQEICLGEGLTCARSCCTSLLLFGVNTLAGAVCTEPAQFRNSPSLLTGPANLPELDPSAGAPAYRRMPKRSRWCRHLLNICHAR